MYAQDASSVANAMLGIIGFAVFLYCIIFGCFTSWLAKTKGRSEAGWFALGFFFNLLALLTVGLSEPRPATVAVPWARPVNGARPSMACNYCGHPLSSSAQFCGSCGNQVVHANHKISARAN